MMALHLLQGGAVAMAVLLLAYLVEVARDYRHHAPRHSRGPRASGDSMSSTVSSRH
jgi:hypothetical protein